jgi:hypothetical protein
VAPPKELCTAAQAGALVCVCGPTRHASRQPPWLQQHRSLALHQYDTSTSVGLLKSPASEPYTGMKHAAALCTLNVRHSLELLVPLWRRRTLDCKLLWCIAPHELRMSSRVLHVARLRAATENHSCRKSEHFSHTCND